MRLRTSALALAALVVGFGAASSAHGQDFDPRGRHKAQAGQGKPHKPTPKGPGPSRQPAPSPRGQADTAAQIEKYRKIVLAQPGAAFPLQRLAQLERDKTGSLASLIGDFEVRAAQPGREQYAATIALAGLYKADGRTDAAVAAYEKAVAQKADDPAALLALAGLLQDRADPGARARYEQALALQKLPADKAQTLRTLMTLALDTKDFRGAKAFHEALLKLEPGSVFVRGELGRELFQRGEYVLAEAEFTALVAAAAGDNRALAPALKELGRAQARAHETTKAIATLERALSVAGREAAVRAELYEIMAELYRADGQLPLLITRLEKDAPGDYQRLALLGSLYEEIGDGDKALALYRRALAQKPKQVDLRLKVIRVLQTRGSLDEAIAEYDALIRAAPHNPQFVFDQCEALMQRGERARALRLLSELEARGTSDEEILSRLADFYGRIGESDKAVRVLSRLAQIGASDPGHLADLGDQYFQAGNKALAVQTWRRILTTVTPRARALGALGEVYLEHEMVPEALATFREACALEPNDVTLKKQLATALERAKSFAAARRSWEELAQTAVARGDKVLAREARTRIVALWTFEHVLEAQVAPLTKKFSAKPPDLEAGRMLAEVELRLRDPSGAETTLRKVLEHAPGDVDGYLALERVLVQQGKYAGAIETLEKLAGVEPKRAREVYQRMAQYALQIYRDDDAIKYAARAVELNPEDAEGHKRLGEMYRQRQDSARAIIEFRAAIAKNERLYLVYLELADLLLAQGQTEEADRLFRRVVRGAPDEELVGRAGRLSLQLNLGKGTLESLEQELLPLAIGNPQRKVYRRLLVDIYGTLTFGLMEQSRHGSVDEARAAESALTQIGGRAVKPLLDTLAEGDAGQQRIAIDVLGYVRNKNAGPALFAYATGQADALLRTRAMLACGALRDPALVPKYEALLFPKRDASDAMTSDKVSVAATWALANLGDRRALPALRKVLKNGSSNMRAFAALGLGASNDMTLAPVLAATARSLDAGSVARAASAFALGELGAASEAQTLVALAKGSAPLPKQMALSALGRLGAGKGEAPGGPTTLAAMTDALFTSDDELPSGDASAERVKESAAAALRKLVTRAPVDAQRDGVPMPNEDVSAESTLSQLHARASSAEDEALAVVTFAGSLRTSAKAALVASSGRARAALDAFGAGDGALEPLLHARGGAKSGAADVVLGVLRDLEPELLTVARAPDAELRTKAITLLARSDTDAAKAALANAMADPDEGVQRAAIVAVGRTTSASIVATVARFLDEQRPWSLRVLAAEALGRLGKAGSRTEAAAELRRASTADSFAIVREAALLALATFDRQAAATVATTMSRSDPEPRVRETAAKVLHGR